jgi:hypothetical protein
MRDARGSPSNKNTKPHRYPRAGIRCGCIWIVASVIPYKQNQIGSRGGKAPATMGKGRRKQGPPPAQSSLSRPPPHNALKVTSCFCVPPRQWHCRVAGRGGGPLGTEGLCAGRFLPDKHTCPNPCAAISHSRQSPTPCIVGSVPLLQNLQRLLSALRSCASAFCVTILEPLNKTGHVCAQLAQL